MCRLSLPLPSNVRSTNLELGKVHVLVAEEVFIATVLAHLAAVQEDADGTTIVDNALLLTTIIRGQKRRERGEE